MTMGDLVEKTIHGWVVDKRISIPAIIAVVSAAITAALFVGDLKNDVKANARESVVLRQEIDDQKSFTKAIPMISERVGRLEATVAASVSRQERQYDEQGRQFNEIKALLVQNNKAPRAAVIRPARP